MAEPTILHWLKSDLPSFEVIRQFSLFKQYKTGSPSRILGDLHEPITRIDMHRTEPTKELTTMITTLRSLYKHKQLYLQTRVTKKEQQRELLKLKLKLPPTPRYGTKLYSKINR